MGPIFTEVYVAKASPIHSFFHFLLHPVSFISFSSLSPCGHFHVFFLFAAVAGPLYIGTSAFLFLLMRI